MTDARHKFTRIDPAADEPDLTDHYMHKLREVTDRGMQRLEHLAEEARKGEDARRAGTEAVGVTFEEFSMEYVRLSHAMRACITLSAKLHNEREDREREAAAKGKIARAQLEPRLVKRIERAIALLAEPDKRPTRH